MQYISMQEKDKSKKDKKKAAHMLGVCQREGALKSSIIQRLICAAISGGREFH